jgi:nucleoside-diphosphate-sugar epimerase
MVHLVSAQHLEPGARVVVTGGAGRAGRHVVAAMIDAGYEVISVDVVTWPEAPCPHISADLRSLADCLEVLHGSEAVVHLAGVFAPGVHTPAVTFSTNVETTFNVFRAAALSKLHRVVWASTCGVAGAPFGDECQPKRLPVREGDETACSSTYTLSKLVGEVIARESRLWNGVSFAGLRFAWIYHPGQYAGIEKFWDEPHARKFNLWTYVDVRDVAQACTKAVAASFQGSETFFITAGDTVMNRESRGLAKEVFRDVELDENLSGCGSLFSIEKAGRVLGYMPQRSWRDELKWDDAA